MPRVTVLVLGDVGRSPRMCYHALSLASKEGFEVDLCGYRGSTPPQAVLDHPDITLRYIGELGSLGLPRALFLLYAPIKVLLQTIQLLWLLLWTIPQMNYLLIQNPPAIPTLHLAHAAVLFRRTRLVIDWHNYGYSLLALGGRGRAPLVRIATAYERYFGRGAYHNLCVTKAMKRDLEDNWGVRSITTLYDRPPAKFSECTLEDKADLFNRLASNGHLSYESLGLPHEEGCGDHSPFVTEGKGTGRGGKSTWVLREDRPALVVSSTSWTPDEDFSLLFNAAIAYDDRAQAEAAKASQGKKGDKIIFPTLVFAITGKGPMKAHYEELFSQLDRPYIRFVTLWLSAEDYPTLLGCADLGICLHTSSSGLDLPMKIVDMFGCKLPVCAVSYPCLDELVKPNHTGLLFSNAQELSEEMYELLCSFPHDTKTLDKFRSNIRETQGTRWTEAWDQSAYPVFSQ